MTLSMLDQLKEQRCSSWLPQSIKIETILVIGGKRSREIPTTNGTIAPVINEAINFYSVRIEIVDVIC